MKPLFPVLILLCSVLLCGCPLVCKVETAAAGAISTGLTKALQCQNGPQVLADVSSLLDKTNICSLPAKKPGDKRGPIASMICPVLGSLAATELANQVPASWQCNSAMAKMGLSAALTAACNLIPF